MAYLKSSGKVQVWGRDPTSTMQVVSIQMNTGNGVWKTVATITANGNGIFQAAAIPAGAKSSYSMRASAPGLNSAAFKLEVPANENLNVTPFPAGG